MVGEFIAPVIGNETFGVDEPETSSSFILGQAFSDEELDNLLGDTNTSTAGTHEHCSLVLGRNTGSFYSVDDSGEYDRAGPLDIVIEAGILVLISLECREGILEVFELDDDAVES